MKTCGIVGGMGPEATALFYMKIIRQFKHTKGYPPILVYSVPEPFHVANSFLQSNQDGHSLEKLVIEGIQIVHDKVDFCVIPCNTAHIYINAIRQAAKVPVFSIVEETCRHLKQHKLKKIGILATTASIDHQLYTRPLYENNIVPILPMKCQQTVVSEVICRLVKGEILAPDKAVLLAVIDNLRKMGAEGVILACTDLPILLSQNDIDFPLFDTLDILAEVAKNAIIGEYTVSDSLSTA
ncbi:MAG: aspartate racemase [Pelosinus sp.]|nr:aspartate racemase [Pelosinus sp.]